MTYEGSPAERLRQGREELKKVQSALRSCAHLVLSDYPQQLPPLPSTLAEKLDVDLLDPSYMFDSLNAESFEEALEVASNAAAEHNATIIIGDNVDIIYVTASTLEQSPQTSWQIDATLHHEIAYRLDCTINHHLQRSGSGISLATRHTQSLS